jgi:hypothetical protein
MSARPEELAVAATARRDEPDGSDGSEGWPTGLDVAAARLRRPPGCAADGLRTAAETARRGERYPPAQPRSARPPLSRPAARRRVTLDWILTIAGAILIVLALKEWVVNPYRIPSSSMEPTLNCAKAGARLHRRLERPACSPAASASTSAPSARRHRRLQHAERGRAKCGEGGTFVKRVIGLPGDTVHEDDNGLHLIRGPDSKIREAQRAVLSRARRLRTAAFGQAGRFRRARTS